MALLLVAGVWAGVQNALAGGGSFVTLPALLVAGLDARTANITSTVALFPGQVSTGLAGRPNVSGTPRVGFGMLVLTTLVGGVVGALLLLRTPVALFAALVPGLVLVATGLFAWGSFGPRGGGPSMGRAATIAAQVASGVYGGYFGGGNGVIMLAILTAAGLPLRRAGASKNVLVSLTNGAAVVVFLLTARIAWPQAAALGGGAVVGGLAGALALRRVDERALRIAIVGIGLVLSVGLALRAAMTR